MAERKKIKALILRNNEISPDIFDMLLYAPKVAETADPGQFVMLYTNDASKLLPRPISICDYNVKEGTIRLVYRVSGPNTGTKQFSALKQGENIEMLGPIGNGYDLEKLKELSLKEEKDAGFWKLSYDLLLVGGGIGIPPMLGLAREFKERYAGVNIAAVLGFRSSVTFLAEEFRKYGDLYFATDDGTLGIRGNVIDAIKADSINAKSICACGPMPMLRGLAAFAEENKVKTFVSLEERMACGIGACLGCVTKTRKKDEHSRVDNARICVDGPVFDVDELVL